MKETQKSENNDAVSSVASAAVTGATNGKSVCKKSACAAESLKSSQYSSCFHNSKSVSFLYSNKELLPLEYLTYLFLILDYLRPTPLLLGTKNKPETKDGPSWGRCIVKRK